jgi:hypothetical protein
MADSGDVLPRLTSHNAADLRTAHAVFKRQDAPELTIGRAAPDVPDLRLRQLGKPLRLAARVLFRTRRASVALAGCIPALGVPVGGVFLRRAFPEMPVTRPHNAVYLVKSGRLVAAAHLHVARVQRLHSGHQRPAKSFLKRECMRAAVLECALRPAASRELAVTPACRRAGPQPASVRRRQPVHFAAVTFHVGHSLASRHRRPQSFGVAGRDVSSVSPCHFTWWNAP